MKCIDEDIPFEIPNHWSWIRLGFLFSHCSGKALNGSDKSGTEYNYITTSNLYWDRFELNKLRSMPFTDNEIDKCTATKGDLLVCEGGDFGRAAIWNYDYDIKIQNHIHKLRAYFPICTRFYYYIFYLYKHIGYIGGKGIGIQGLSSGALHQIILPIVSIEEQQRIVNKIEELLPSIEKYGDAQQNLDNLNSEIYSLLKKSILQDAIQGKLVEQCKDEEPASKLLERIRQEKQLLVKQGKLKAKEVVNSVIFKGDDNKYYEKCEKSITCIDTEIPFDIPDNWLWVRLKYVANIARGGSPRPIKEYLTTEQNGVNWIKIGDTEKNGKYINSTNEKIKQEGVSKSRMIHKGDFLLTNSMSFGRPYISNIDGCIHDGWLVISPYGHCYDPDFLYYLLSSQYAYIQFCGKVSGAVVQNLNSEKVANAVFPLPPYNEQKRIVAKIELALASTTRSVGKQRAALTQRFLLIYQITGIGVGLVI